MTDNNRRVALGAMIAAGMAGVAGTASAKTQKSGQARDIDRLLSHWAVQEVLVGYARANDLQDEAMLRDCFWPESTHKHGRFEGKSQDFVGFAMKILTTLHYCAHHISNISIQIEGDRAFSECYYFAHHRRDAKTGGEEDAFMEGRYLDILERRDGVWKIIRRHGISDYSSPAIPAATPYADWPAGHTVRSKGDAYYMMLKAFREG